MDRMVSKKRDRPARRSERKSPDFPPPPQAPPPPPPLAAPLRDPSPGAGTSTAAGGPFFASCAFPAGGGTGEEPRGRTETIRGSPRHEKEAASGTAAATAAAAASPPPTPPPRSLPPPPPSPEGVVSLEDEGIPPPSLLVAPPPPPPPAVAGLGERRDRPWASRETRARFLG